MRGADKRSGEVFFCVALARRVRRDHPLRPIREIANGDVVASSGPVPFTWK